MKHGLPERPRAVITGGGSGIGRAFCLQIARRGGRVLVADLHKHTADETVELVRRAGGEAVAFACDVADANAVEALAREADARFGGTDLVVNNAGVGAAGRVGEVSLEDWRWIVGVNLWGVVHGCHAFVPRLRAQGRGAVINVASTAGVAAAPEMGAYNTTKAAVIALSETLAAELSGANIGVTVLCPTFITTGIFDAGRMSEKSRESGRRMAARSKYSADDAARDTIAALERGELYVFPQPDARWVWRLKRLAPRAYAGFVGLAYRRGLLLR